MLNAIPQSCLRNGSKILRNITRIQQRNFAEEVAKPTSMIFTFASPTEVRIGLIFGV